MKAKESAKAAQARPMSEGFVPELSIEGPVKEAGKELTPFKFVSIFRSVW